MTAKNIAVFGIFQTYDDLERTVDALRSEGYRNTDISFLMEENVGSRDLGHRKATKSPEGVTVGATSGVVLGGALGWLVGIGALTIPGLGPFVAAGPIIAALAGAGAAGTTGGLIGGLIGLGMPEYEAKRYEGRVRKGGLLMSVHCDNAVWAEMAIDILERSGAEDISSTNEATGDLIWTDRHLPRTGTE